MMNVGSDHIGGEHRFRLFDVAQDFSEKQIARFGQNEQEPIAFALGQIGCRDVPHKPDLFDRGVHLVDGLCLDAFATV